MSQDSFKKSWERLSTAREWSKDERFMAALRYLLDNTYTYILFGDSYPIEVSEKSLTTGAHFLDLHSADTGHTQIVFQVNAAPDSVGMPIVTIWSNTPTIVRELDQTTFFQSHQPTPEKGGFLRLRWPVLSRGQWVLKSRDSHPFYSTAQYRPEFMAGESEYVMAVFRKIRPNLDFMQMMKQAIQSFSDLVANRVQIVAEGFEFCKRNDCAPGTQNFEAWSTPHRDGRIKDVFQYMIDIFRRSESDLIRQEYRAFSQNYTIEIDGVDLDVNHIVNCMGDSCSSDPRDPIKKRWGIIERK